MIKQPHYLMLMIASFCIVGTSSVYEFNHAKIATALNTPISAVRANDMQWLADILARILGGLISYFMYDKIGCHNHFFAILSAMSVFIGNLIACIMVFIGTHTTVGALLPLAGVFIGFGVGGFIMFVAQAVFEEGGIEHFAGNWGL